MKITDLLTESVVVYTGQYIFKDNRFFYILESNLEYAHVKESVFAHLVDKIVKKNGKVSYTRTKPPVRVGLTPGAEILSAEAAYQKYTELNGGGATMRRHFNQVRSQGR